MRFVNGVHVYVKAVKQEKLPVISISTYAQQLRTREPSSG